MTRAYDNMEHVGEQISTMVAKIESDMELSDSGKRVRIAEGIKKLRGEFVVGRMAQETRDREQSLKRELFALPPLPAGTPVELLLLKQEHRVIMRGLSVADRLSRIAAAVESGDSLLVSAVIEDPGKGLLDQQQLDRLLRQHAEKNKPNEVRMLDELQDVAAELESIQQHFDSVVQGFVA